MSFWEVLSLIGFGAIVLGAWLPASSYCNGRATRALMRDFAEHSDRRHTESQAVIQEMRADTQQFIQSMEERTAAILREMQSETRASFERMDQRADDRHRETIEAIRTLRA